MRTRLSTNENGESIKELLFADNTIAFIHQGSLYINGGDELWHLVIKANKELTEFANLLKLKWHKFKKYRGNDCRVCTGEAFKENLRRANEGLGLVFTKTEQSKHQAKYKPIGNA